MLHVEMTIKVIVFYSILEGYLVLSRLEMTKIHHFQLSLLLVTSQMFRIQPSVMSLTAPPQASGITPHKALAPLYLGQARCCPPSQTCGRLRQSVSLGR